MQWNTIVDSVSQLVVRGFSPVSLVIFQLRITFTLPLYPLPPVFSDEALRTKRKLAWLIFGLASFIALEETV